MNDSETLRVELDKFFIGYILAKDVLKEKEVKLISKDVLITERLYESLKRHKIKYIYVYKKAEAVLA